MMQFSPMMNFCGSILKIFLWGIKLWCWCCRSFPFWMALRPPTDICFAVRSKFCRAVTITGLTSFILCWRMIKEVATYNLNFVLISFHPESDCNNSTRSCIITWVGKVTCNTMKIILRFSFLSYYCTNLGDFINSLFFMWKH